MRDFPPIYAGPDMMEYGGLVIARGWSRSQSYWLSPSLLDGNDKARGG